MAWSDHDGKSVDFTNDRGDSQPAAEKHHQTGAFAIKRYAPFFDTELGDSRENGLRLDCYG